MVDQARARKLADRIAQIVAEMLERRIKDPRLGFVTVTEARLTGDLREATVFYTVYGSTEERSATAAALASAAGVIRSEVGHQTGLKHTPSLTFVADTLPEGARHMEDLVARAREADARLAAVREGAEPAGDPDPYREPAGTAGDLDDDDDDLDDDEDDFDDDELDEDELDEDDLDDDELDEDEPDEDELDASELDDDDLDDDDDDELDVEELGDGGSGDDELDEDELDEDDLDDGEPGDEDLLGRTSAASDHGAGYSPP